MATPLHMKKDLRPARPPKAAKAETIRDLLFCQSKTIMISSKYKPVSAQY